MEQLLKVPRGGLAPQSVVVAAHSDGQQSDTDTTTMEVVELTPANHERSGRRYAGY